MQVNEDWLIDHPPTEAVPFTGGVSLVLVVWSTEERATVRVADEGTGSRLIIEGRMGKRVLTTMRAGLGLPEPA
jgi:hypothetical protein